MHGGSQALYKIALAACMQISKDTAEAVNLYIVKPFSIENSSKSYYKTVGIMRHINETYSRVLVTATNENSLLTSVYIGQSVDPAVSYRYLHACS